MKSVGARPLDLVHLEDKERKEGLDPKGVLDLPVLLVLNQTLHLFLDKSLSKVEKRVPHQTLFPTCKHKLDLLDHGDLQVCEVHLVLRALWDLKVTMGIQVHLDLQDLRAYGVFLAWLVKKEKRVVMESLVQPDLQDHLENVDLLGCLVFQALKDTEDSLD